MTCTPINSDSLEAQTGYGIAAHSVAMPSITFGGSFLHDGLFEMAAAYAFHIAENQPFVDGNKRTALNAALVFLYLNGWDVEDPQMELYDGMLAFATHSLDKPGFAQVLERLAVRIDD